MEKKKKMKKSLGINLDRLNKSAEKPLINRKESILKISNSSKVIKNLVPSSRVKVNEIVEAKE